MSMRVSQVEKLDLNSNFERFSFTFQNSYKCSFLVYSTMFSEEHTIKKNFLIANEIKKISKWIT